MVITLERMNTSSLGVTRGYGGLQEITGCYRGLQVVSGGNKGLQEVTRDCKRLKEGYRIDS